MTAAVDDKNSVYSYDEAVELTGHGRYNYLMLLTCCVSTIAVAMDMFGFSVVVAAASCDLELSMSVTGLLNSMPFAGIMFAFFWGYYADTRGRRSALLLSSSVGFVLAVLTSLSPSWQVMLGLKLIGCIFSSAAYTLTMTYLGECTGSMRRRQYLFVMNSFNLLADFIFYLLAYLILPLTFSIPIPWLGISLRPWRVYSLILAAPLGLGALMLLLLQESPKLLASRGRSDEALDVLRKMYEWNGGQKETYPVKFLSVENVQDLSGESFWRSIVNQTGPLFKPPLLWRTIQLFYLVAICCSTNNVFFMWYPLIVNLFFNSYASGAIVENQSFCQRVVSNISTSIQDENYVCDDTISLSTMYAGMMLGLTFAFMNLAASAVAAYRKLVLMAIYLISAVCLALVELLREPVTNMIAFTMVLCTAVGISSVASYFVDLYPTSCRGLGTSLGIMFSRLVTLGGVNLVGAVIIDHCTLTFYSWMVFVASGIVVALFLPKDTKQYK